MVADFRPTYLIIKFINWYNNRAYPLLSYIYNLINYSVLIYNVWGEPAIFSCGRYVASGYNYYRYYVTYGIMFLTYYKQLIKNSGI